jgi:hypothetical protein
MQVFLSHDEMFSGNLIILSEDTALGATSEL